MEKEFLNIIKNKKTCYFISPHLDDAVISSGDLITYLKDHTNVVVVNVFTKISDEPYTLSAKTMLQKCGYKNAQQFYADRVSEDNNILNKMGVKRINLNYCDAQWRKRENIGNLRRVLGRIIPELLHIYPIYKLNILNGKVSSHDDALIRQINKDLSQVVEKNAVVFCPIADSGHVDHLIVRDACRKLFDTLIFWSDLSYRQNSKFLRKYLKDQNLVKIKFNNDYQRKIVLIKKYKTQKDQLFTNGGFSEQFETYYLKSKIHAKS